MKIIKNKDVILKYNFNPEEFLKIAKQYKCKIIFHSSVGLPSATAQCRKSLIELNLFYLEDNKRKIISALFHELGHMHCYKNNIWYCYHHIRDIGYTKKNIRRFKKTAYRAESWVDLWAEKEMKKYYPKFKYKHGYLPGNKNAIKWLNKYYEDWYELYL